MKFPATGYIQCYCVEGSSYNSSTSDFRSGGRLGKEVRPPLVHVILLLDPHPKQLGSVGHIALCPMPRASKLHKAKTQRNGNGFIVVVWQITAVSSPTPLCSCTAYRILDVYGT